MQDIKKRWKPYYDEKKHFLRLEQFVLYDRKFLHSEETILKMPAFMRAPKQDDY